MDFWYIFFSSLIGLWVAMGIIERKWRFFLTIIYLTVIIIVCGLRNYIGTDFPTYVMFYERYAHAEFLGAMDEGMEPAFALLVYILGLLGGKYQLLFFVYSAITILGMYYGFKKWLEKDGLAVFLAMLLYITYNSTGGFWWGMNVIRQAAAMSVAFAFSECLMHQEKKKFLIVVCIASLFHYSALVFLPAVFLLEKEIAKKRIIYFLIGAIFLTLSGVSKIIVLELLNISLGIIGKYEEAMLLITDGGKGFSYMSLIYVLMFIGSILINKESLEPRQKVIWNLSFVYIIMRVLTSFSLGGPSIQFILHRFEVYYMPFFLLAVSEALMVMMERIKPKVMSRLVVAFFLIIMSSLEIITIAKWGGYADYPLEPNYPPDIVEYEINTDLCE